MAGGGLLYRFTKATQYAQSCSAFNVAHAADRIRGTSVLIVGGTQGIGLAVAKRFAELGASHVSVSGRSEHHGRAALAEIHVASPSTLCNFFPADLSLVSGMRELVHAVERTHDSLDYLVLCAGGPPIQRKILTPEGLERHFAVQNLSRYVVAQALAVRSNIVTRGVCAVAAPMQSENASLDPHILSDLNLTGEWARSLTRLGLIARSGARDSAVIDATMYELALSRPELCVGHLFPGAVQTGALVNAAVLPSAMASLLSGVAALTVAAPPEDTANFVVRTLIDPAHVGKLVRAGPSGAQYPLSPWLANNAAQVVSRLADIEAAIAH